MLAGVGLMMVCCSSSSAMMMMGGGDEDPGGGAGGGGISTGEGLIIKPSVGMNYQINSGFSLRGAVGYVKARGGSLSSPMINLGLSYRLAFLSSK